MSGCRLPINPLPFFIIFVFMVTEFRFCSGNPNPICRKDEKQALLCLKLGLKDPSTRLSSWVDGNYDCCTKWAGVVCDNVTGHVTELHLANPAPGNGSSAFGGELSPCLLELKQLSHLDLSGNDFEGTPIPSFLGSLLNLEYLDLSEAGFEGDIPHHLGNLTGLQMLSIRGNAYSLGGLKVDSLEWLSSLSNLQQLDFSYVDLSNALNWVEGTISNSISNLTSLAYFSVSHNNMLSGEVSKQIGKLCDLKWLSLSANKFSGLISELFQSMSGCVSYGLVGLHLDNNQFSGPMFESSLTFPLLTSLGLGGNKINGTLAESLGKMFPMLRSLDISNNIVEGLVTENYFVNLKGLVSFHASGNRLTLKVSSNWLPPFKLKKLGLGSWHLGPQFPIWLQSQKEISKVDISNAGIKGEVPTWFWNLSSQISLLNLSHNLFCGPLPQTSLAKTKLLDLSNNFFSGDVVHFLCHLQNGSNRLKRLYLKSNSLSGQIPDCLSNWPELQVLDMAKNNLSGRIPKSVGLLKSLSSLDLNGNKLFGNIPSSLQNCTNLLKLDLGENELQGNIPSWLGSSLYSSLVILRLHSNKFHGKLPPDLCQLKYLQILDVANNNIIGSIPRCLNNLTSMVKQIEIDFGEMDTLTKIFLGESATVITKGQEYQYSTIILVLVRSFDLSNNNFSGKIPVELTTLVELRFLNLSRNKLT